MSEKGILKRQNREFQSKLLYLPKSKRKGRKSVYEIELQKREMETKREEDLIIHAKRLLWEKDQTLPLSTAERNNRK